MITDRDFWDLAHRVQKLEGYEVYNLWYNIKRLSERLDEIEEKLNHKTRKIHNDEKNV